MKTTFLGLLFVMLCLVACRHEEPLEWSDTPYLNVSSPWVDSNLQSLSLDEKMGQLLYLDVNAARHSPREIIEWNRINYFGGLQVYGLSVADYRKLEQQIRTESRISPLIGTKEQVLLNNQFAEAGEVPGADVLPYLSENDSLRQLSRELFRQQMSGLGFNAQFSPYRLFADPSEDLLAQYHLQFVEDLPADAIQRVQDSVYWDFTAKNQLQYLQNRGVAGFSLPTGFLEKNNLSPVQLADLFRNQLDFKGLLVAEAKPEDALLLLAGTVDLLRINGDPIPVVDQLREAYRSEVLTDRELEVRVSKVLQAKEWLRQQAVEVEAAQLAKAASENVTYDRASVLPPVLGKSRETADSLSGSEPETIDEHFDKNRWRLLSRQFYERSSVLLNNRHQLLPFRDLYRHYFRLVHLGGESRDDLESAFGHYADFSKYYHLPEAEGRYPRLRITPTKREICVVSMHEDLEAKKDSVLLHDLRQLAKDREVVLLHFGTEAGLAALDTAFSILHFPEMNRTTQELAAQILFGGASPQGKLPQDVNAYFRAGIGDELPVTRLSYQIPEALGISPEKLVGIDAIAKSAIEDGAFPGCQVLVAKSGSVIYSKAFGYHDYDRKRKVEMTDLYDVASITKVAATTLAAMKLYEQGKYEVNDRLKNYIDCPSGSTIKNIQVKKLLIHQSGLQPHMPVVPYLLYRDTDNVGCDSFFCSQVSEDYPYQIADNFYFNKANHDKIWEDIHKISVGSQRRYRYSDANFFLVQQVLESVSGIPLDDLVRQYFYTPLGLRYTTYRPLERFPLDRIVPTQDDDRWRHQKVHGYVHDETAALLGGVSGHAGLFANAEDLAVIFQMLLNKGYYGDRQYLEPETIDLFTTADHGNHRGYGFDTAHPDSRSAFAESASQRSFGHTGFTGTCVWADPDNDLVFVFLSNRINPSVRNKKLFQNRVRERMHQVVYDALDTYSPQIAERQIVME
ncbi:serine hydrolase [Flavilitoribacter nigricans]|uniref:Beta-lactamase-related domain-containing protein n=1 Tax=Flavilitoribacter nigricans (strain ATCC 23147 / DSM 23189 / NBRC 102662 / NCIMB 1420 / SS-2) TaxID=1122177 RepID=A0A2D0MZY1_FLAN2|nr:serine hydrolase [Flavilitoribacter nigricans]PHN01805.1 hypothetical protein CRP01_35575 [Flavilitoribacter nigricans DSM 23189 = NBRC 102662]